MRMMFSDRQLVEMQFVSYCDEHHSDSCAGNFLAWLLSTDEGNKIVLDLYHDVISDRITGAKLSD